MPTSNGTSTQRTSPEKSIQNIYETTCEQSTNNSEEGFRNLQTETGARMNINKLPTAFTRDKNIRYLLIHSCSRQFSEYKVNVYLNSIHK